MGFRTDELDELLSDNRKVILRHISDELRAALPPDAMLPSESTAYCKVLSDRTGPDRTTASLICDGKRLQLFSVVGRSCDH